MYYIGIDVGGMSIKAGIFDEKGKLLLKDSVRTLPERHYSEIVADMAALTKRIAEKAGVGTDEIAGVGMGIPGTINSKTGMITYANNINFEKVPVVKEFQKHLDVSVYINNDANAAALGEAEFGSGNGSKDVVFVTLGTGVGTGIITDGVLLEGKCGAGAEGGHMTIRMGGEKCTCGKRGCWEAYASASALMRQTEKAMKADSLSLMHEEAAKEGKISGRTAFNAMRRGDRTAKRVTDNYIKYVAEGIINMVNLFRPDCVLIGGGISNEGDWLMAKIQRRVNRFSFGGHRNPKVYVRKAVLGNDAGMYGAAALAMKKIR